MDLINVIINKKNWKNKLENPQILAKWEKELNDQHAPKGALNLIVKLLNTYKNKKSVWDLYDELSRHASYKYVSDITLSPSDLDILCTGCDCLICTEGNRYCIDDALESGDDEYYKTLLAMDRKICKCVNQYAIKSQQFIDNHTYTSKNLISNVLNVKLIHCVDDFKHGKLKDYHPGSDNKVIDIVHPSMYCYVDGVTELRSGNVCDTSTTLFRWLPTDFSVEWGNSNNVTQLSINSYINNISTKYEALYRTIGEILSLMVPKFNNLLAKPVISTKLKKTLQIKNKFQAIVKIGRTELYPDKPVFPGGSWHLEGMPDENIVATGIYYFNIDNMTPHSLDFRTSLSSSLQIDYPQNGTEYVKLHYDMDNTNDSTKSVFNLGKITPENGMCLIFPNFLQHKVSRFELEDPQKYGYRDILVFFLIDPTSPVVSTGNVARQQKKMSESEAEFYRELLMFERKYEINDQNLFYERGWSLCEH